ncbi:MAG: Bax inhibitor-1 family protein, partial [Alphaproteobacteria bacterium]
MENRYSIPKAREGLNIDAGLRGHFNRVYNIMALGLAVTGTTAYAVSTIPGIEKVFMMIHQNMFLGLAVMTLPMMLMMMLFSPQRLSYASYQSLVLGFVGFSAFWGALLSVIFLVYSPESIIKTFFITAGTFAGMSIIGYTAKVDL